MSAQTDERRGHPVFSENPVQTAAERAVCRNRVLLLIILGIVLVVFVLTTPTLDGRAVQDFSAYWAATRLLLDRGNPYDPIALRALQESVLSRLDVTVRPNPASWNPPWLMLMLMPLGLLPFSIAARLMLLVNVLLVAGAVAVVWHWAIPGDEGRGAIIALLVAIFSHGSFMTFMIGQISSLVLISLVASFYLLSCHRDMLAGALLLPSLIKPHIVYFVFAILGIWVIRKRRWGVVIGGVGAFALSLVLCTLFYRSWLVDYWELVGTHDFMQYSTSTVGGVIYALTGSTVGRYAGVLLTPAIPVMLNLVDSHGWLLTMNVALLISLPLGPYGFSFDQIVLVPALVQCVVWLGHREMSRWFSGVVYGALGAISALSYWMLLQPNARYHLFTWIPVLLTGLYFAVWRRTKTQRSYASHFGHPEVTEIGTSIL